MEREFLRKRLEGRGLDVIVPEEADRMTLHEIVFGELVLGRIRDESRTESSRSSIAWWRRAPAGWFSGAQSSGC
jgi:aspartate/glutamate racemase